MRIEFLGTGGAITVPRPGHDTPINQQARRHGPPYSRSGPSVFVHGPDVLIDTPEEIKDQLNRAGLAQVPHCLYSHWHPDHVMGRRVWENLNGDWTSWPHQPRVTRVFLPQQVAQDFRTRLASWEHLAFLQSMELIEIVELADGDTITLNGVQVRPFRLAESYMYGFEFVMDDRRALIIMDELLGWTPPPELRGVDVVVLPMGIPEQNPLTGERFFPADHPLLDAEATFAQSLEIVRQLEAGRVYLTHIELDLLGYDDLKAIEGQLSPNISFAYDTMVVEV